MMIFMNLVGIDKFEIQKCERAALASRAAQRGVGLALSASPLPLLLRLLVHSAAGLISRQTHECHCDEQRSIVRRDVTQHARVI